jgi:hypothetical protein
MSRASRGLIGLKPPPGAMLTRCRTSTSSGCSGAWRGSTWPAATARRTATAFSVPAFKPASTHSRTSLASEPWCSAIWPAQSGRAASSIGYQASACERTLVNTSVLPPPSASVCAI